MSKRGESGKTQARNPDGSWRNPVDLPEKYPSCPHKGRMKRRPKGVEEIIAGLQEGSLDKRTKTAMQFQAVKEALGEDPKAVAKALLRHDVAVYAVINRAILEYVQNKQGEIITEKGELPALVTRDLPKFQGAMTKAIEALIRLEGKGDGQDAVDVASLILDCSAPDEGQGGE